MKVLIVNILKLSVALGLIFFLINKDYLDLSLISKMNISSVFLVLSLSFIAISINNLRWTILLKSQGLHFKFRQTLKLSFIGMFFNFALPSSIGGDVVKAFYLIKSSPQDKSKSIMSVVVDRILGLVIMLAMAIFALLMNMKLVKSNVELATIFSSLTVVFISAVVFLSFAFSKKINASKSIKFIVNKVPSFISSPYLALSFYGSSLKQVFTGLCLSVCSQLATILIFKVAGDAVGLPVDLIVYMFAVPIGLMIMSLPIAPAGIGVGQVAFLYLFNVYTGESVGVGTLVVTIFQMSLLVYGFVGAYFYVKNKTSINQVVTDVR